MYMYNENCPFPASCPTERGSQRSTNNESLLAFLLNPMLCSSYSSDEESPANSPRHCGTATTTSATTVAAPNGATAAGALPPLCRSIDSGSGGGENGAPQPPSRQPSSSNGSLCNGGGASPATPVAAAAGAVAPNVKPWYLFNETEKALLRLSWRPVLMHLEEFGVEIYVMIFEQCPEARELFPFMRDVISVEKARKNFSTEFSFQALRFVQILESGVNALDDLSSLDLLLHNLGRRHGKLNATNIFRSYYWSVFLECAIHKLRNYISTRTRKTTGTLTDEEDINRCIILWRRLLEGIIERIEAGFIVDIANRRSNAEQRGTAISKWKYTGSTRAGWMTASKFKSTESLIQSFSPFRGSPLRTRSRSRELQQLQRLQQQQQQKK